jgi:hypothetical protein
VSGARPRRQSGGTHVRRTRRRVARSRHRSPGPIKMARDGVLPSHMVERNMPYQADPRKGLWSSSDDALSSLSPPSRVVLCLGHPGTCGGLAEVTPRVRIASP